jgi:hypothetical protein
MGEKLRASSLDFRGKRIEWSDECIRRAFDRGLVSHFGNDLKRCKEEIDRLAEEEGVIVESPDKTRCEQKWCLVDVPNFGLVKIPLMQTYEKIITFITIATPVSDPRCREAFSRRKAEKINKGKTNSKLKVVA